MGIPNKRRYLQPGFFLLRHFGHRNISVICLTAAFKLTTAVFISFYFRHCDWNDLFIVSYQKDLGLWPKQTAYNTTKIFCTN